MNIEEISQTKILELLMKMKFVVTPIRILKKMGFPVTEHKFILENKTTISKIKQILIELEKDEILVQRKSKQDFKGIKEIGYDYIQ